jgi:hypothetical protein
MITGLKLDYRAEFRHLIAEVIMLDALLAQVCSFMEVLVCMVKEF